MKPTGKDNIDVLSEVVEKAIEAAIERGLDVGPFDVIAVLHGNAASMLIATILAAPDKKEALLKKYQLFTMGVVSKVPTYVENALTEYNQLHH